MQETLWLVINTLETVTLVATEDNLSKMLGVIQTLKTMARSLEPQEEQNGGT